MKTILTIGFNKKSLRRFVEMLKSADADAVIDIRLNNTSQLAGYTKKEDLEYILELLGIPYEHHLELAPAEELLSAYRKNKRHEDFEKRFSALIAERDMARVGREILSRYSRPCLLCAEELPDHCHRRLVAEEWARKVAGVQIEHLI